MNKWIAAGTLVGVAATAVVAAGPATSHDVKPSGTLALTGNKGPRDLEEKDVDVRPRGISVGDKFYGAQTLRQNGAVAGRLVGECTAIDARYEGHMCSVVLILKDGRITAHGASEGRRIPGVGGTDGPAGEEVAITGGTGAYRGATGTVLLKSGRRRDLVTVQFTP